jgi:hypothetical protein
MDPAVVSSLPVAGATGGFQNNPLVTLLAVTEGIVEQRYTTISV